MSELKTRGTKLPKTEVWYEWKVLEDTDDGPRLFTPWKDPNVYETPFDYIFPTIARARQAKADLAPAEEGWILVKKTYKPIEVGEVCSETEEDEDADCPTEADQD